MERLACIGILVGDFVVKPVTEMPEMGKLTLVDTTELHIGGCASNTGIDAKRLGADVAVIGKTGKDALGDFVTSTLAKEGIETTGIKREDSITTSGTAVLVHPDGERSFIHSFGANSKFSSNDVDYSYLQGFKIVHVAGIFLMPLLEGEDLLTLCRKVKSSGRVLSLDTAWDSRGHWFAAIKDSLPFVDYFFTSFEEAKMLSGKNSLEDMAEFLLEAGAKNICLKMGEKGAFIMNKRERKFFPAVKVDVVDSTGAGDAYVAGFLVGLLKGYNFLQCGHLANLVGAQAVTAVGATTGIRSWDALVSFARKHNVELP